MLSLGADNLVHRAAVALFRETGMSPPNFALTCHNAIPLERGLGSSAAAAVGGCWPPTRCADEPLSPQELLRLAVRLEGHPDNARGGPLRGVSDRGAGRRRASVRTGAAAVGATCGAVRPGRGDEHCTGAGGPPARGVTAGCGLQRSPHGAAGERAGRGPPGASQDCDAGPAAPAAAGGAVPRHAPHLLGGAERGGTRRLPLGRRVDGAGAGQRTRDDHRLRDGGCGRESRSAGRHSRGGT